MASIHRAGAPWIVPTFRIGDAMPDDPWALPAIFYSIIVKREAVVRSYLDGPEEFEQRFQPARKNGALYLLTVMSLMDAEAVLGKLNENGVIPGEDIAVADMVQGPMLECPGLAFRRVGQLLNTRWWVNVAPRELEREL